MNIALKYVSLKNMEEKKVIKEIKTPIKYLVKKLNKIDSSLTVKPLTDNPDYIVFNGKISEQEEVLYYFNQRQYSSYGLMRFIEDHNTDDFIEINIEINKAINVWLNSKEKNGSTMPFEDDISNDSQKKPVLSGLYTKKEVDSILKAQPIMRSQEQVKRDFIDYLLDQGIGYKAHTSQSNIEQIEIENEAYDTICSINFLNDGVNQVWLYKVGRVDKKQLETILGLYEQILEMMEELMRLKEDGDGK